MVEEFVDKYLSEHGDEISEVDATSEACSVDQPQAVFGQAKLLNPKI